MGEDYRAGASLDRALDDADAGRRRIISPVLVLWSAREDIARWYDVLAIWREWADQVQGRAMDRGHYLAEEKPDELAAELGQFFD